MGTAVGGRISTALPSGSSNSHTWGQAVPTSGDPQDYFLSSKQEPSQLKVRLQPVWSALASPRTCGSHPVLPHAVPLPRPARDCGQSGAGAETQLT